MSLSESLIGDWSELPELTLATIARLLTPSFCDLFSFASVCCSWRSLLRSLSPSLLPSLPPLLLNFAPSSTCSSSSSFHDGSRDGRGGACFLSPAIYPLPFPPSPLSLPSPSSFCFLSFSHGHLLFLPSSPPIQPFLANVITNTRILLPTLPSDCHRFPYYYATLTAPPSDPSSRFLLFWSTFAFLSCPVSTSEATATWTRHCFSPDILISFITHVVTFKNRLLGLNNCARLLELNLSSDHAHAHNSVRFLDVHRPPRAPGEFDRSHFGPQLVCTSDQILLVLFIYNRGATAPFPLPEHGHVTEIEVYSLDWRRMEWVQVKRLQDSAIFIDCAGKAPVLCEKPEKWGGESNCVYVARPGHDRWMRYSLDETRFARMQPLVLLDMLGPYWPSPIWTYPSLFY